MNIDNVFCFLLNDIRVNTFILVTNECLEIISILKTEISLNLDTGLRIRRRM